MALKASRKPMYPDAGAQTAHERTTDWVLIERSTRAFECTYVPATSGLQFDGLHRLVDLVVLGAAHPTLIEIDYSEPATAPVPNVKQLLGFYAEKFADYSLRTPRFLLGRIAGEYGLAWADIARTIGVSVPAVRKWRIDGHPSDENAIALARLCTYFETATLAQISDPARWFTRFLVPGFTVTPRDVYRKLEWQSAVTLLASRDNERYLDTYVPNWRADYETAFEVNEDESGNRSVGFRR